MKRELYPVIFEQAVTFLALPKEFLGTIADGDTTPSVLNVRYLRYIGTTPIVITNFDQPSHPQVLYLLGNSLITISHNSNISTNTGANKVLVDDKMYTFHFIETKWYESE